MMIELAAPRYVTMIGFDGWWVFDTHTTRTIGAGEGVRVGVHPFPSRQAAAQHALALCTRQCGPGPELLWVDPDHPDGTRVAAMRVGADYRVYRRVGDGPWCAITDAMGHEGMVTWFRVRIDPVPVPDAISDWLELSITALVPEGRVP